MTLEPCTNHSATQMVGLDAPFLKSGHGYVVLCRGHWICSITPQMFGLIAEPKA